MKPGSASASTWARSWNSVRVKPGQSTVTATPVPFISSWTDSENDVTNAFVALYVAIIGPDWKPASDDTLRMPPLPTRRHCRRGGVCQPHERDDVELDLARLSCEVEFGELAVRAVPRVVDQQVDGLSTRLDGRELRGVSEIRGQHLALRARGLQLLRERIEAGLVARDEHEIVAAAGQLASKLSAESRRRAGNESDGAISHGR